MRVPVATLEPWITGIFCACDMPPEHAGVAARSLVRSDLRGYRTHGVSRVASYAERLRAGTFNPRPDIGHRTFPGGICFDADGAMGHVAASFAITAGLEALQTSASVFIAMQSCGHLGALGIHALQAAEQGVLALIGQRTPPMLSMPGFSRAAIGHNPFAFACPTGSGPPVVFDIACSVAARGHILLAAREKRPIPPGWAVDASGKDTTDADAALEGALLPMGGHKGIGIAMLIECLAGALSANAASLSEGHNHLPAKGAVGRQGGFMLLIKPGDFADPALFTEYMKGWTDFYLDSAPGQARIPGGGAEALERQGREHGLEISDALWSELVDLGMQCGIPLTDRAGPAC